MGMTNKHAFGHARATRADFGGTETRGKVIGGRFRRKRCVRNPAACISIFAIPR
jgi:hypothetical protein